MFTKNELEATKDFCENKIDQILNSKDGSNADYIRNLQTLITLKNAANKPFKNRPGSPAA